MTFLGDIWKIVNAFEKQNNCSVDRAKWFTNNINGWNLACTWFAFKSLLVKRFIYSWLMSFNWKLLYIAAMWKWVRNKRKKADLLPFHSLFREPYFYSVQIAIYVATHFAYPPSLSSLYYWIIHFISIPSLFLP